MENKLDVKLFYREKNGVKLTEKGKKLFEIVNKSISSFDFAEKAMKERNDLATGTINIGYQSHLTNYYLMEYIKVAKNDYPNLNVELTCGAVSSEMFEMLKNHKLDFVITDVIPTETDEFVIEELKKVNNIFVAKEPLKIENVKELEDLRYILNFDNTITTKKLFKVLKEHNVAVFFEEEGINTLEMSGELLLTILSSVAQQESENTSTHVKLGLKMKKERGELIGFGGCLGYTYNSEENTLTINEDEAKIVRLIYSKYLEGYGAESISRQLTREGIKSPKGKDVWCETTIRKILKNEKYKGDVLQGKTFTIDHISHKRLSNMGEEDKYYISNHHEAIIDEETFEKVQQIMKERNECNKLLDYMLDGTIDKTTYAEKKEDCLAKIKEIDTQITKIKDTIEDDDSVERGLRKFKKVFDDNTIMEEFDIDVFDALVDYIIVGGYNESGRADPYMLRFIVKTRSNILKKEEDVSKEHIVERSKLTEDYKNFVLLDFIDKQNFIAYDRDKEGNFKKRIIKKVRVRVECVSVLQLKQDM